jgi:hypothetical protein
MTWYGASEATVGRRAAMGESGGEKSDVPIIQEQLMTGLITRTKSEERGRWSGQGRGVGTICLQLPGI